MQNRHNFFVVRVIITFPRGWRQHLLHTAKSYPIRTGLMLDSVILICSDTNGVNDTPKDHASLGPTGEMRGLNREVEAPKQRANSIVKKKNQTTGKR